MIEDELRNKIKMRRTLNIIETTTGAVYVYNYGLWQFHDKSDYILFSFVIHP